MKQVVIAGVSGSLGKFLGMHFASQGFEVIGISRTNPKLPGVRHIAHDLANSGACEHFGLTPVINAAAVTQDGFNLELERVNLQIAREALAISEGPFIQVSSSSVYDLRKASIDAEVEEATGKYPFLNSYSRSKFQSEQLVLDEAAGRSIILRPHALVGPNDNTLLPRVKKAIRGGVLRLPRAGQTVHQFTSFANFAHATELAIDALNSKQEIELPIFNVSDGSGTSIRAAIESALGKDSPRFASVPTSAAWMLASAAEKLSRQTEPKLSRYQIAQLAFDRSYDLTKTKEVLGYDPTTSPAFRV